MCTQHQDSEYTEFMLIKCMVKLAQENSHPGTFHSVSLCSEQQPLQEIHATVTIDVILDVRT